MDFGFKNIMNFAMNIDKLVLANLVWEVMDKIVSYPLPSELPAASYRRGSGLNYRLPL